MALNNLANVLEWEDKLADAEAIQREALAMQRKLLGTEHPDVARLALQSGAHARSQKRSAEAETLLQEALAAQRKRLGSDHPGRGLLARTTGAVLGDEGKLHAAGTALQECLSIREKRLPDDWLTFSARSALGENLLARRQYAEAEPLLISGYNGLRSAQAAIPVANKPRLEKAAQRLVRFYEETGRPDKAAEWKKKLGALAKPKSGVD